MEYVWMVVCPLIGIAIISFLSRKLSARTAFIVTALLFIAMAASGIAKQIVAIATGYDLWYLPLHFSSTFYITVGVSVFAHGKAEHAAQTILFVGGIIMCAMILVRPAAILGNLSGVFTSHIHAHGYFYHMLVVLQFGIMLARGNYRPKRHDPLFFAGGVALWGCGRNSLRVCFQRQLYGHSARLYSLFGTVPHKIRICALSHRILSRRSAFGDAAHLRIRIFAKKTRKKGVKRQLYRQ